MRAPTVAWFITTIGADRCKRRSRRRRMTRPPTTTELLDPLADLDGEDLACLGLRRANAFIDVFADLNRQAHEDWIANLPQPSKPKPPKPPTLAAVAKQASQAGI